MERFLERLDDLVFLDVKKEALKNFIDIDEEYLSLPMFTDRMVVASINITKSDEIPMKNFIEGIFYSLGVCDNIKNKLKYVEIIKSRPECFNYIKGEIYKNIKEEKLFKAYLLLKGLFTIEENLENYEKLLKLCFELMSKNFKFIEEMKDIISIGKEKNLIISHLYESYLYYHLKEFDNAKSSLDDFLAHGGSLTKEQLDFKDDLSNIVNYNLGKEKIFEDPSFALKLLIPLMDDFSDDPSLLYYIALGYRKLGIYEKAIFYLKEALFIDESFMDCLNEMGLNYALLGLYDEAIRYFEKVYSSLKNIEVINNLILCYHYINNKTMVSKLIEEGKIIAKDDEIFLKTIEMIKNEEFKKD